MSLLKLKNIQKKITIKKSKIPKSGKGAFSKEDLPKGTFLGWYRGKLLNENQREKLKDDGYVWVLDTPKGDMFIDAKPVKENNKLRYINGAKNKNQKKKINVESYQYNQQIRYRTIKNVKKGQEFIIDYGEDYWESDVENDNTLEHLEEFKPKNKAQKSFTKGLIWCVKFCENERHFNSQGANYIVFLYGLICVNSNRKLNNIIKDLLIQAIERASKKLKKVFKDDSSEILPVFASFGKIKISNQIKNKYRNYYNKLKKEIYEGNSSFKKNVKKMNFDDLSDEAVAYTFLHLAKKYNSNIIFPKDRLQQYKKELGKLNIKQLEKQNKDHLSVLDYHVTHVLFVFNLYHCKKLPRKNKTVNGVEKYLLKHSGRILNESKDIDLIGETLDCMLTLNNKKWNKKWKKLYINHLIKKQTKSGKWYTRGDKTLYDKFHGNWACTGAMYLLC